MLTGNGTLRMISRLFGSENYTNRQKQNPLPTANNTSTAPKPSINNFTSPSQQVRSRYLSTPYVAGATERNQRLYT